MVSVSFDVDVVCFKAADGFLFLCPHLNPTFARSTNSIGCEGLLPSASFSLPSNPQNFVEGQVGGGCTYERCLFFSR